MIFSPLSSLSGLGNNMLTDSHCHLSELDPKEINSQLVEAKKQGVNTIIVIGAGYGFESNIKTLELAKKHDNLYCALAIHPHDAKLVNKKSLKNIKDLITSHPKVCAVGETGLDYHYMHSLKETQQAVFKDFIELAKSVNKPVVIHDRECAGDCVGILKELNADRIGGVAHCFSGTKELAFKYLDLGFYISFSGIITFKKAHDLREIAKSVPLDRILIETDAPFLAPEPFRGKQNQPSYVKYVAQSVANIKNKSYEEIAHITTQNAARLFNL